MKRKVFQVYLFQYPVIEGHMSFVIHALWADGYRVYGALSKGSSWPPGAILYGVPGVHGPDPPLWPDVRGLKRRLSHAIQLLKIILTRLDHPRMRY